MDDVILRENEEFDSIEEAVRRLGADRCLSYINYAHNLRTNKETERSIKKIEETMKRMEGK